MNPQTCLAALCIGLTAPWLLAQRAACTGTLRDPAGVPIARAAVTFCQELSQTFGVDPDRVEVETDADGVFSAALLHGSPYVVWAIGPADGEGGRWVTGVSMDGAGGKAIELTAVRQARPRRIALRGTAAWIEHGPAALHVLVDGRYRLGCGQPLAGDGVLPLGPWPDCEVQLSLVDDAGGAVCRSGLFDVFVNSVELPAPRAVSLEVVDDEGKAVAGARITVCVTQDLGQQAAGDPLPARQNQIWRQAARSDAAGRATVLVPWASREIDRHITMVATAAGYAASVSGFFGGKPFADCRPVGDESKPLRFVMRRQDPTTLRVGGLRAGQRAWAMQVCVFPFEYAGGRSHKLFHVPTDIRDGLTSAVVPSSFWSLTFCLRLSPWPGSSTRVCWNGNMSPAVGRELDLEKLNRCVIKVTDGEGRPVPFAHVAIGSPDLRSLLWHDRCVADGEGRVRLSSTRSAWTVAASDGRRVGFTETDMTWGGKEVRVKLLPMPLAHVRVVDGAGAFVAGARIGAGVQAGGGLPADWLRLECVAACASTARSDRFGYLTVPIPEGGLRRVVIKHGGRRSSSMSLAATKGVAYAELR